jgi:hypothetical protein
VLVVLEVLKVLLLMAQLIRQIILSQKHLSLEQMEVKVVLGHPILLMEVVDLNWNMLEGMLMVFQLRFIRGVVDIILLMAAFAQAVVEQVLEEMGTKLLVNIVEQTAEQGFQAHYGQTLLLLMVQVGVVLVMRIRGQVVMVELEGVLT